MHVAAGQAAVTMLDIKVSISCIRHVSVIHATCSAAQAAAHIEEPVHTEYGTPSSMTLAPI